MTAKLYLICALVLESISGTTCYDYNVGGMVAASLAGFIFLIAIVLMTIILVMWRDWYMKRQAGKGRYRIPREKWQLFRYSVIQKPGSQTATPRSDRRVNMHAWVTRLPPTNHYEEKTKTLKFEPEEDNVIIADVMPDTNLRTTQRTVQPVVIETSRPELRQTATYQDSKTTYVHLKSDNPPATTQFRQTTPAEPISYEPYHVHVKMAEGEPVIRNLSQTTRHVQAVPQTTRPATLLSQTMPAGRGTGDIYIQPIVPTATQFDNQNQNTGVVMFESDDEAGNIPTHQTEDVVLF